MSETPHDPGSAHAEPQAPPEPTTPMWLPALGGALFVAVGLWWATTPRPQPPPEVEAAASSASTGASAAPSATAPAAPMASAAPGLTAPPGPGLMRPAPPAAVPVGSGGQGAAPNSALQRILDAMPKGKQ